MSQGRPLITWSEFERVELRAGTIVSAQPFPGARKPAYRLLVDLGELGIKKSSAQITSTRVTNWSEGRSSV